MSLSNAISHLARTRVTSWISIARAAEKAVQSSCFSTGAGGTVVNALPTGLQVQRWHHAVLQSLFPTIGCTLRSIFHLS